jgi:peptidoglycan/xylan/chitin deacetylase (PgdA/CDA1 family)
VVLTFDDAFVNFAEIVWPILEGRGLPSTVFVPVEFLDGGPSPLRGAERLAPMSWTALRELGSRSSVEIGSHSLSHPDLRQLADEALERELRDSRARIEDAVGRPSPTFCYPKALCDARVAAVAAQHYEAALGAGGRRVSEASPLSWLPRVPVRRDVARFEGLLRAKVYLEEVLADVYRRNHATR